MFKVPCFPRGELVAVAGKAKSGKTLFLSLLMANTLNNDHGPLTMNPKSSTVNPEPLTMNQPLKVLWYDTEQSRQSTHDILKNRIVPLMGKEASLDTNFYAFNVRTFSWEERLEMFKEAIPYLKPDLVVLDGVRDLLSDINDGREAQAMTERLMQLAQQHKCCMVCVLHQNKSGADNTMRGWIGTELTNKVFEVYNCEKLRDRTFKVEQTMTRKYDIGRQLYYRVDEDTQLPVVSEHPACSQPRDAQGRWVCQNAITVDLRKLFTTAMEGSSRKPFNELMAVALKKCGVVDARTYYSYLDEAQAQDIIRIEVHPATGKKWVTLTDGQLPF
jgi:archaellum biogenesis ATPase FlaH